MIKTRKNIEHPADGGDGAPLCDRFPRGYITTFIHLSSGKAGPFALESHIHVKALKMQGVPNNWMPRETLLKKRHPKNLSKGVPG